MLTAIKLTDEQLERIRVVLKDLGVSQAYCSTGPTSMPLGKITIIYRLKEGLPETAKDFNALGEKLDGEFDDFRKETGYFPKFSCWLKPDEFFFVYGNETFFDFTEGGECMKKIMEYYETKYTEQEMVNVTDMIYFYTDSEIDALDSPDPTVLTET